MAIFPSTPHMLFDFVFFPFAVHTETTKDHRTETRVPSFSILNKSHLCHNCIMFMTHLLYLVSALSFFHFPVIYIK